LSNAKPINQVASGILDGSRSAQPILQFFLLRALRVFVVKTLGLALVAHSSYYSMDRWNVVMQPTVSRNTAHGGHPPRPAIRLPSRAQIEAGAAIFQALGDPERLRLLVRLAEGEACVSELAEYEGEKISTVSARLKTLYAVRLVKRRREAKHIYYTLADEHVLPLVRNAIDHAAESRAAVSRHGKDD